MDTILPLAVLFSAKLNEVCHDKIQTLSISFDVTTKSLASSMMALSKLCRVAERVELKLDALFRRPRVSLLDVVDQVKDLESAISLKSLAMR